MRRQSRLFTLQPVTILAALALPVLTGCVNLPRGAGLQSEVLAADTVVLDAEGDAVAVQDFDLAPVTRATVPVYAAWPDLGGDGLSWIARVDQPDNRVIATGDTLAVTIWATEDNGLLTAPGQRFVTLPDMRVSSSGRIFLPYIGDVPVAGMAPETARARIEERYLAVTPSAQVQLDLTEGRQSSVSLVSGVARPGAYPLLDQDMTVMELIAQGGGVPSGLNNPQIRLARGDTLYGIAVERLLETPHLNTTLQGGDRIHVEEDNRYFLSLGAAGSEARHPFPQQDLSALEALSIIGGVSDSRADPQGILILRRYPTAAVGPGADSPNHPRTIFTIDLTSADGLFSAGQFEIQPDDLIYVTESPLQDTRTILSLIGSVFGLARQVETSL